MRRGATLLGPKARQDVLERFRVVGSKVGHRRDWPIRTDRAHSASNLPLRRPRSAPGYHGAARARPCAAH
eukprot:3408087-Alexandrium_andersonii.AAC.1